MRASYLYPFLRFQYSVICCRAIIIVVSRSLGLEGEASKRDFSIPAPSYSS